jgi:hypothetical protein
MMYGIGVPHRQGVPALGIQATSNTTTTQAAFTVLAEDVTVAQPKQLTSSRDTANAQHVINEDGMDIRVARRGDVLCAVNEVDVRALGENSCHQTLCLL